MRTKLVLLTALVSLAAAGAALAAGGTARGIPYAFVGRLAATPAGGAVSITVDGGNRAALRALLGQPAAQTFATGDTTEFLRWTQGVPAVVSAGDLAAGDVVRITVRAPRGASLAEIEQRAAAVVGDHGAELAPPSQPLYRFRGALTAVDPSGAVTLDVRGGNHRAMRLMIGQQASQTFTTGGQTIFLLWQGKTPTVIDLAQLVVGDRVVVRVRADRGSTLAQVEATAAVHVGDREPANAP